MAEISHFIMMVLLVTVTAGHLFGVGTLVYAGKLLGVFCLLWLLHRFKFLASIHLVRSHYARQQAG